MEIFEILTNMPKNQIIVDNFIKAYSKINSDKYQKILCSISGGADSDVVLDICTKCDVDHKIDYVWFDTGLEYQATKDHLKELEAKYGVTIRPYRAIKPIPLTCKQYGQPFISKHASEMIRRLQAHNFQWENESFDILFQKYPKCKSALEWWCCTKPTATMNITRNAWLKEFMMTYPPDFNISNLCCKYAKKDVAHKILDEGDYDMQITGLRKAEGGVRATAYKSCFDEKCGEADNYRPIWWYKDDDKKAYENFFNVIHSKCYTEYGLERTGCAGCPYGKEFEDELAIIEKYEPRLYVAVNNIFGKSYEYTRKYREFCEEMNKQYKSYSNYLRLKEGD